MSSASRGSATCFLMKLRSRGPSRDIASEMRSSCFAIGHGLSIAPSIYPCRRRSAPNILGKLVLRRAMDTIDHQHRKRGLPRLQFKTELVPKSDGKRRLVVAGRRSLALSLVGVEIQQQIVVSLDLGLIEHGLARRIRKEAG